MQFVTLNNGVKMPVLGFGVYQIPPSDTERAVSEALGAQELPQSDDCLRRGLGTAEVATHSIGDREDGRNRQPGVFIFGADGTDVSRRAPR